MWPLSSPIGDRPDIRHSTYILHRSLAKDRSFGVLSCWSVFVWKDLLSYLRHEIGLYKKNINGFRTFYLEIRRTLCYYDCVFMATNIFTYLNTYMNETIGYEAIQKKPL